MSHLFFMKDIFSFWNYAFCFLYSYADKKHILQKTALPGRHWITGGNVHITQAYTVRLTVTVQCLTTLLSY